MTRPHVTGWHQAGTDIRKRSCVILIAKPVPHSVTAFGTGLRRCDTQGGAGLHGLSAGGKWIRTCMGLFLSSGLLVCWRFFVRSAKVVLRPVACDQVRGACFAAP